jgi:hypothetical protein
VSTYVWGLPRAKAAPASRRRRLAPLVGTAAAAVGHILRLGITVGRYTPGAAGATAVSVGAWLAWAPAGFAVAGGFLLLLDRRLRA